MWNKDKTSVWLDLNSCLIPSGYDVGRIVPGIKKMLEDLGHHGPVTITATGDLKNIPEHVLRALFSSGINVTYVTKGIKGLFQCMLEWKSSNPPPATIMIIASVYHLHNMCVATRDDEVDKAYTFVQVYARPHFKPSGLQTRAGLFWENILFDNKQEPTSQFLLEKCSETSVTKDESAWFFCKRCQFSCQSVESFTTHLSCEEHAPRGLGSVAGNRTKDVKMIGGGASLYSHPKNATSFMEKERPETLVDFRKSKKIMKKTKKKFKKRSTK